MNSNIQNSTRPLGYWLETVDSLISAEFARAFEAEGAGRRDWRLLGAVDGTGAPHRPLHEHKLHRLIERGWVARDEDGFRLTDEGRAAKDRLDVLVEDIRSRVRDAVSDEALETTFDSLEKVARAFGWTEEARMPRRGGHARHGRGHHRGGHPHRGRGRDIAKLSRFAQRSYERGFDAGFTRGREA